MNETCGACRDGEALDFAIAMAYQPIVDITTGAIHAYEALVRGAEGQGAGWVLSQVTETNRYAFDQACRVQAIATAARLGLRDLPETQLHINFLPNAVYRPETCIRATLKAANTHNVDIRQITFEMTENEQLTDHAHLRNIVEEYKRMGFGTAIDDFGSGFSGLNLLVEFQPDEIKLDMHLIRGIDADPVRQSIVRAALGIAADLNLKVVAEGVETLAELETVQAMGVRLVQGYLLCRPAFEELPSRDQITMPVRTA